MIERSEPFLSVVVATRNDDHGGDPLARLQAFVNTFAAQCRRSGLDAEVIVVEWNPPADRPRVHELLRIPPNAPLVVRFVEVPPAIHQAYRFAAVLPLFQMIAKNVGIRRARGRFILATNIDIIFSSALVEWLASGRLEPHVLYRVNRHDIESDFPVEAALAEQMAYCETHQIRVNTRIGTHVVDRVGRQKLLEPDVVGSAGITLGDGWHPREGDSAGGFFRWTTPEVRFAIDRAASPAARDAVLDVDLEVNPYQPHSWVDLEVLDGSRQLARRRVSGRTCLRLELDPDAARHEIVMRAVESSDGRDSLPLFQSREQLWYRVHQLKLRQVPHDVYELGLWQPVLWNPKQLTATAAAGVEVVSDRRYPYCARYYPFESTADSTCDFLLECAQAEGQFRLFAWDEERNCPLPSRAVEIDQDGTRLYGLEVDVKRGDRFSLYLANARADAGLSSGVLRSFFGSVPLARLKRSGFRARLAWTRPIRNTIIQAALTPLRWVKNAVTSVVMKRAHGLRETIVESSERLRQLEAAADSLAPLADLAPLARFLTEHRPPELHQNACGDFQLMAREHWFALRGYPEFEMFSMSIDGLMESLASAAGIREHILEAPLCIYHLEHQKGSGWTPEGEALLRKRIAESGITWLDAHTVHIWSAYMMWLKRPMIFNGSEWGLGDVALSETALECAVGNA